MENPFQLIMEQYADGAEKAYIQLLEYCDQKMPSLNAHIGLIKRALLKGSFAFLAMDYTVKVQKVYEFEDFQYFIDEMRLPLLKPEIYYLMGQANLPWETFLGMDREGIEIQRFQEMLWKLLIVEYRKFWKEQLFAVFKNELEIQSFLEETILEGQALSDSQASAGLNFIKEL